MNFSKVLPNLNLVFSILVSKCASCSVAARDIARIGFIPTIPDTEEIAVAVIVEGEVRVKTVLLLAVEVRSRRFEKALSSPFMRDDWKLIRLEFRDTVTLTGFESTTTS